MSLLPELQDILRLLDRFVGHYPIYLYLVDSSNRLIWFNSHMAEQLPQFHIGQQLDCQNSLWPCDEKCQHCQENKPGLTSKIERHLIHQSPGSGSKERYLEFISLPIYQTPNKIEGVLRLGIDVTENERLQAKLREKEKLFSAIINTSTDAIIFLDKDDIIRSWNKGAEEIFGYSEAEMIGKPIQKLIPHELIEMDELSYFHRELKEKGVIKKYETQRLHKSGRPIYVDISCTSIFDEKGNFVGTSEIMKDIDARKELEFELLRTILELSKLNELNEILYSTYDEREIFRIILIAITAGEGLRFNRAFLLLLNDEKTLKGDLAIGPSDEEEASRIWSELNKDYHYLSDIVRIYNIDLEGADKKVNEIVHQIEIPLEEEENICVQSLLHKKVIQVKNGQLLQGDTGSFSVKDTNLLKLLKNDSFVIVPLFTKKELLGVIIADNCINKREITPEDVEGLKLFANQASSAIENARLYRTLESKIQDLKQAYQELEENQQKLIQAKRLAAIGEMSARVAHEIRNPLVSIGGFARLIERKISGDDQLKQYAGIIKEQVSNLENILNNILATANPPRPQDGRVSIPHLVEQITAVLHNAISRRNIKLFIKLPNTEVFVRGDEKLLHQAFLNLLKNAIEALDKKTGQREITIQVVDNQKTVDIYLRDNGEGIPEAVLPKIFQTFFTTKSSGTGLGLSIVHQIVEAHNGTIQVESEAGKGTTFIVQLPRVFQLEALPEK